MTKEGKENNEFMEGGEKVEGKSGVICKEHTTYKVIYIPSVPDEAGFRDYLESKAMPAQRDKTFAEDWQFKDNADEWAYEWDYVRFIKINPYE